MRIDSIHSGQKMSVNPHRPPIQSQMPGQHGGTRVLYQTSSENNVFVIFSPLGFTEYNIEPSSNHPQSFMRKRGGRSKQDAK